MNEIRSEDISQLFVWQLEAKFAADAKLALYPYFAGMAFNKFLAKY